MNWRLREMIANQRWGNRLRSWALVAAVFAVFLLVASMFFRLSEAVLLVGGSFLFVAIGTGVGFEVALRLQGARPWNDRIAPGAIRILDTLARRAGLPNTPRLYIIRAAVPNAFAMGTRSRSAICVTTGLLEIMSTREIGGILAHEVGHIRNGDALSMGLVSHLGAMARLLSWFGMFALVLSVPVYLADDYAFPWLGLALLVAAPTAIALLQLALSRSREFAADLTAAEITGDPAGLASALGKLDYIERNFLRRFIGGGGSSAWLSSHPATRERIARLDALQPGGDESRFDWLRARRERPRIPERFVVINPPLGRIVLRRF